MSFPYFPTNANRSASAMLTQYYSPAAAAPSPFAMQLFGSENSLQFAPAAAAAASSNPMNTMAADREVQTLQG